MRKPEALRWAWHHLTLRGSRRTVVWRMRWRARNPVTFNDRIRVKMLLDRRPLLTTVADKVAARDYIAAHAGPEYVCPMLAVAAGVDSIDWESLPEEYAAKVNHGCGGQVIVTRDAPADARLPEVGSRRGWGTLRVRPEHAPRDRVADLCRHWLTLDYSWIRGRNSLEWCYADIPRRVFIEPLLRDAAGAVPREYWVFVIGGSVAFLQVELDRWGSQHTAVMSPEWQALPFQLVDPPPPEPPERPERLAEILDVAERLARPLGDFLRVDLYDLGTDLVVGELTNYPNGGESPFSSPEYAELFGRGWRTSY